MKTLFKASKEQEKYAHKIATEQNALYNYSGKRFESSRVGVLVETVLCDHFGEPRPEANGADDFDLKIDGVRVDVKTRSIEFFPRSLDELVFIIEARLLDNPNVDAYLFCLHHSRTGEIMVIGQMKKRNVRIYGDLVKEGDLIKRGQKEWRAWFDQFHVKRSWMVGV